MAHPHPSLPPSRGKESTGRIVALCGGVGGAKLAYGLSKLLAPDELYIVVNTGDDFEHLGLTICPDIDTVTYTLAEVADDAQGWGRADERWSDRDIALHLLRAQLLRGGLDLTQATLQIARSFGVPHAILPMSNTAVRTIVHTNEGDLPFQDYFVRRRCLPQARGFSYAGAANAAMTPQVADALADDGLRGVIICPSNPYVSVAPILALPGLLTRLRECAAPVLAVSPIVGGHALKGPAAKMMLEIGVEVSALTVARRYGDFADAMLLDEQDRALSATRGDDDPQFLYAATIMHTAADRVALARICLQLLGQLAA
jgi:LPPG:FO 2-phospho-L-lactate transferase